MPDEKGEIMAHDFKPHWKIVFERERGGPKRRDPLLWCFLYRGEHKNAPLKEYLKLASIPINALARPLAQAYFWKKVRGLLYPLSDEIGVEYMTKLVAQIDRLVPPASSEPVRRTIKTRPAIVPPVGMAVLRGSTPAIVPPVEMAELRGSKKVVKEIDGEGK